MGSSPLVSTNQTHGIACYAVGFSFAIIQVVTPLCPRFRQVLVARRRRIRLHSDASGNLCSVWVQKETAEQPVHKQINVLGNFSGGTQSFSFLRNAFCRRRGYWPAISRPASPNYFQKITCQTLKTPPPQPALSSHLICDSQFNFDTMIFHTRFVWNRLLTWAFIHTKPFFKHHALIRRQLHGTAHGVVTLSVLPPLREKKTYPLCVEILHKP